jgi:hypothetical protein
MNNIELYRKEINAEIADINIIEDEKVSISYGDTVLIISTYHSQDCCENVYADFSVMEHFILPMKGQKVANLIIKGVKDMGFLLCFEHPQNTDFKIFIPCYNFQNGYYSANLSLDLKFDNVSTKIDISDFVPDHTG